MVLVCGFQYHAKIPQNGDVWHVEKILLQRLSDRQGLAFLAIVPRLSKLGTKYPEDMARFDKALWHRCTPAHVEQGQNHKSE